MARGTFWPHTGKVCWSLGHLVVTDELFPEQVNVTFAYVKNENRNDFRMFTVLKVNLISIE